MELADDITPESLRDVLAELGDRVAPTALARERLLPVQPAIRSLFPDGGLVRGRVVASAGGGAATLASAVVRDALIGGAWMAVVDVMGFGADAAKESGVPLERIVRVDTRMEAVDDAIDDEAADAAARRWLEVMAAVVDGFDVVLTTVPSVWRGRRPPAAMRSLLARIQQRGAVVVVLGRADPVPVDLTLSADGPWRGLGAGHGVLVGRRLAVEASGRRQPVARRCDVDLRADGSRLRLESVAAAPVADGDRRPALVAVDGGRVAAGADESIAGAGADLDPSAQVVAEMAAAHPSAEEVADPVAVDRVAG